MLKKPSSDLFRQEADLAGMVEIVLHHSVKQVLEVVVAARHLLFQEALRPLFQLAQQTICFLVEASLCLLPVGLGGLGDRRPVLALAQSLGRAARRKTEDARRKTFYPISRIASRKASLCSGKPTDTRRKLGIFQFSPSWT